METDENEKIIIDKKEIEIGDRKIEVRLIECNVNQHDFYGQRVYAKFIDNIGNRQGYEKDKKKLNLKKLRKILDGIPDEEIFEDSNNGQDASAIVLKEEGRESIEAPVSGSFHDPMNLTKENIIKEISNGSLIGREIFEIELSHYKKLAVDQQEEKE